MTNDFDELVSAYLDGETTPEETARVEGDPELRAAADSMRALAGEVARVPRPSAEVRSAHLAAALDAFDASTAAGAVQQPGAGATDAPTPIGTTTRSREVSAAGPTESRPEDGTAGSGVVSLEGRRARREQRRSRGVPSWLGAAAATVLVVGGLGYALQQSGGSNDSDTASADFESEASDEGATTDTEAATESAESFALDSDDAADDRGEAFIGDAEEADEAATAQADDAPSATTSVARDLTTTTAPGLFPQEIERNRIAFDTAPTEEELAELAAGTLLPADWSTCGAVAEPAAAGALITGFVPVSVDGVLGEVLVYEGADNEAFTVVVDGGCEPLP